MVATGMGMGMGMGMETRMAARMAAATMATITGEAMMLGSPAMGTILGRQGAALRQGTHAVAVAVAVTATTARTRMQIGMRMGLLACRAWKQEGQWRRKHQGREAQGSRRVKRFTTQMGGWRGRVSPWEAARRVVGERESGGRTDKRVLYLPMREGEGVQE